MNPTAFKVSAKLIINTPQVRQEIRVDLNKILSSKATDLTLQDNDILFVPNSATKSALHDLSSALPGAAAASIYRIP
jgi:polysaccharide export outer membrane protein